MYSVANDVKPPHKFIVRFAFHWNAPNQLPDEVLPIKSALACALVDADLLNRRFYFVTSDDFALPSIFGCHKFQHAEFVALFPFAIRFLADVTDFTRDDVSALE